MITRRSVLFASGAVILWPLAKARGQSRVRVVGVLMGGSETDPAIPGFLSRFSEGLASQGWAEDELRLDVRYTAGNRDLAAAAAAELVSLRPDAILSNTTLNTLQVARATDSIPIVFLPVADPVSVGLVESYARPGGNATGFTNFEPSHAGKWIELLLAVVPTMRRVALIFNPSASPLGGEYYGPAFDAAALGLGLEPVRLPVASQEDIAPAVAGLAGDMVTGLVGDPDIFMWNARRVVRDVAEAQRMAAIYPFVNYTDDGGLMSYSVDTLDLFRRGGEYVGLILNGADVATLPVQSPTRFQLAVNLTAARRLGVTIPLDILATADQIIE